jgi:hypothetical protein
MIEKFFNECLANQWIPNNKPDNIFDVSCNWPYSVFDFDADFDKMLNEIISLEDTYFVKHRDKDKLNSYNHEGWNAVTLHGIDPSKTEHFDRYGFKTQEEANYHWTEVCEFLPTLTSFIKSLEYSQYDRVRIMKLKAGGFIMPHTDGKGRIFGPLNVAINNPEGCRFGFKNDGLVPFKKGRGVFLDLGREHAVWNNSNEDRYHVIVHGHINPKIINESINYTNFLYGHNQ